MGRQRRSGSGVKWLNHYSSAQSILVVGDGDLSFSLALAAAFGSGENLVATSLDSYDALTRKYGKAESNVTELERLGATVFHGVDTKMMKRHPCLKMRRFDRIVFNFPHAGFIGQEQQDHMIKAHQLLVRRFFRNASHLLHRDGEIHVSHRTGQPYDRWQIEELASEFSLVISEIVTFRKEAYPGYNQKRGDGEWCDEEFPLRNGCTYKFRVERGEAEKPRSRKFTTTWRESLHRQQESLDAVTKLHQEKKQQLLLLQQELISISDSPSGDKFYRPVKPIEPKVSPPEKILHATAKGEMEPRHPVSSRHIYPVESRLDQGVNRPKKHSLFRSAQKAWCAKSPGTVTTEAGKSVQVINTDSIIIVTQVLNIREPIVSKNQGKSKGPILTIVPKPSANDHKASTSQAKPSDPKYTQPKWCPSGLTKTQKRKLQSLKNQEKVEKEAERQRDESFNKDRPMIPSAVWVPKKTDLVASVAAVPSPAVTVEEESDITPLVPAKIAWADEAKASDLQERESAKLSEQMSESAGEESADLSEHMSESAYALEEESDRGSDRGDGNRNGGWNGNRNGGGYYKKKNRNGGGYYKKKNRNGGDGAASRAASSAVGPWVCFNPYTGQAQQLSAPPAVRPNNDPGLLGPWPVMMPPAQVFTSLAPLHGQAFGTNPPPIPGYTNPPPTPGYTNTPAWDGSGLLAALNNAATPLTVGEWNMDSSATAHMASDPGSSHQGRDH